MFWRNLDGGCIVYRNALLDVLIDSNVVIIRICILSICGLVIAAFGCSAVLFPLQILGSLFVSGNLLRHSTVSIVRLLFTSRRRGSVSYIMQLLAVVS